MDIGEWLKNLGLGEYEAAFHQNAVDSTILADLTSEDLKEMGVTAVGHRRKILVAIDSLRTNAPASVTKNAAATSSRDLPGERRRVAVLFSDLVGYTSLTEALGAEAMHSLLDAYFSLVDTLVERHGGRVDKHIGDCVMGVFGAPIAHGNDAERAIATAIEIRKATSELSARFGREIKVHVGVTIGVVVASYVGAGETAEYAVTGESVNLASRLADAAAADEILVSEELHQALEGRLMSETAGTLQVKGIAAPVSAWRVIALRDVDTERGPFVGRQTELRQFRSILDACSDNATGHVIALRGEAGMGKTRIGEEFQHIAETEGFACHRGLVLDFGAESGRDAVRAIIRDMLGVDLRAAGDTVHRAVDDALTRGIIAADLQAHLYDLLDASQPDHLRADYDALDNQHRQKGRGLAVAQILQWMSERTPRLLFVEDVHWATPSLLEILGQVGQAIRECPIVLIISSRIDNDPLDRSWRASVVGTSFTTIDLNPLRVDEAQAVCRMVTDDPATIERLVSRADGNPLFLEQLLRHSRESEASDVPGSIRSLVQASIDQLSPADKTAIQAASVIGQRVDPDLVCHLIDDTGFDFDSLVERNMLRFESQSYLFAHALIRDVVYGSLLTPTRIALHRRAAVWFEESELGLSAEHLALVGSPEAHSAFLAAARHEIGRYHFDSALALIERGLQLAEDPTDRVALCLLAGDTWLDIGRVEDAEVQYSHALHNAGTPEDRSHALIGIAGVRRIVEETDSALEVLEQASEFAVEAGLLAEQSRIHFLRGNLLFPRGDFEACHQEHEEGLRLARQAGRQDLETASLGGLGDAEYVRGRMVSARARLEECVRLASEQDLGRIEVANHAQLAHTLLYTSTQEEALEVAGSAIEHAARIGHARAEINARAAVIKALFVLARYEACLEEIDRYEIIIEQLGVARFRQIAFTFGGGAMHALGRSSEAIAWLERGLEFARATGHGLHGPSIASALAVIVDDPERKRGLIELALSQCAAGCVGHNQFRVYADGIDVAFDLPDKAMLVDFIEAAESYPSGERVPWNVFHAARGRALLEDMEHGDTATTRAFREEARGQGKALAMHHWLGR
ncbi:MAG: AAA family ATPase, partial [Rhodospirillaceae bacterium]|nr:AAA family ATPase [Rhodospirillaceae bacterium]